VKCCDNVVSLYPCSLYGRVGKHLLRLHIDSRLFCLSIKLCQILFGFNLLGLYRHPGVCYHRDYQEHEERPGGYPKQAFCG